MVTSCKNYITEFGTVGLWEQSSVLLIAKLKGVLSAVPRVSEMLQQDQRKRSDQTGV